MRTESVSFESIEELVREAIAANRLVTRTAPSQAALDLAIEALQSDGEIYLAAAVLHLMAMRVMGKDGDALQCLMQLALHLRAGGPRP